MGKLGAVALAAAALALAIAACGGSSARSLKVDAVAQPSGKGSIGLVGAGGGGLLYFQYNCPPHRRGEPQLPQYRLLDTGTGMTTTYPCSESVVAGGRGQLLVVGTHGRAELSAPAHAARRVQLPAHTVEAAVAPDGGLAYVKDLRGGHVCMGRVTPGERHAGRCPPLTLPGGEVPGPLVVSSGGALVLIPIPSDPSAQFLPAPITLAHGAYVVAHGGAALHPLVCTGFKPSMAAAGDGSVWMACPYAGPYRLSPDGRTIDGVPGMRGYHALNGPSADALGNIWMLAAPDAAGPTVLLRYRAGRGTPGRFVLNSPCNPPDALAVGPADRLWVTCGGTLERVSAPAG